MIMKEHTILQKLMMTKIMNEGTRRAVRERLKLILENEQKEFRYFEDSVKEKLNLTRARQVERRFNKRCQALKIVIFKLTPYMERTDDVPSIIVKKGKK